ncbi:type VII secretion target [Mycobacterium sp.]|uniref:type VII secretion target n=1 Tax=Mycobacterium sp. TaxID=1785 RepID=UPI002CAB4847|nr:type VII secretion target [Mycobacterium sp.]HKP39622.1 type VII secretion target [Mycobacterium sp.]
MAGGAGGILAAGSSLLARGRVVVSNPNEPLKVDPTELHLTADQLDGHASDFLTAHQTAHSQASQVNLGAGLSTAALPHMLAAWETDSARFAKRFATNAEGHRDAATRYVKTDTASADGIDDAGAAL